MATKREPSDQVLHEILKIRQFEDSQEYSIIWQIFDTVEDFENQISFPIEFGWSPSNHFKFKCSLKYVIVEEHHDFSLELHCRESDLDYPFGLDENMYIALSLIDKNKRIRNTNTKVIKTIDEKISTIKFAKYIKDDDLYDENYSFFSDYYGIKIYCKIYFGEEKNTTEQIFLNDDIPTHCQLKVLDNLNDLFESEKFTDMKFIIGDREIKVHRNILSASESVVFKDMIEGYTPEETDITIEINDVSYETMKEVLRFIYTGKVNDIKAIAKDIFVASEKYEIEALKMICEDELTESLSIENISDMLKLVDVYDSEILKESVFDFICKNKKEISNRINFDEALDNLSFDLLKEIIEILMSE